MKKGIRRRDAIKGLGALAGTAAAARFLPGCGGDGGGELGITTIVSVMMENRSYDHYLGSRSLLTGEQSDGLTATMSNPDLSGTDVAAYHDPDPCVPDPPHSWTSSHRQFNAGANDGFLREYQQRHGTALPPAAMGYLTADDIPITHAIADHYASCDAWYASLMTGTWPNRMYHHAAQSGGITSNDLPGGLLPFPSIHHALDTAAVPWKYYYGSLPFVPLFEDLPVDGRVERLQDFFDDAANGELPPVSYIDPIFFFNDDHPPVHPMLGQQFIATIYAALASSPQWNNVLLVVTYDEHGGFFDHAPPPTVADARTNLGFGQLGFRVPTVVAGPYVKQGHVSSVVRDHTSFIRHVRGMFDIPALGERDAAVNDLSELLDQERLEAGKHAPPTVLPAIEVDEVALEMQCAGAAERRWELDDLVDAGVIDSRWDLRALARDTMYDIGAELDRLGAGRIRR